MVAGLPEPFTEALVPYLKGTSLEVAEAGIFLGPPRPFDITLTLTKEPHPPKTLQLRAHHGWRTLDLPTEYEGGVLHLRTSTEAILYRHSSADSFLFGSDRRTLVIRLVGPRTSARRVALTRPNVREDLLPSTPEAIAAHPDTATAWIAFIKTAR